MTTTDTTELEERLLKVDRLGRVCTSAEEREAILERFERSGMSGTRFARLHGIKYSTFATWVQKRKRSGLLQRQAAGSAPSQSMGGCSADLRLRLAEVVVDAKDPAPAPAAEAAVVIKFPGGASLELNHAGQVVLAAELLKAMPPRLSC